MCIYFHTGRRYSTISILLLTIILSLKATVIWGQFLEPYEHSPMDKIRETGIPAAGFTDYFNKYNQISCGGDLNVNIPIFGIPGKIPIDLTLGYQSGIKVDQPAGVFGLGWDMASWSVRRITVHGDDPNSFHPSRENTRFDINDMYLVSIPGRALKFINIGTLAEPVFTPLSYSNDTLFSNMTHKIAAAGTSYEWHYYDHNYFVMIDENATRYVFAMPLEKRTVPPPNAYHLSPEVLSAPLDTSANAEWLLTAILSHDYLDTIGNFLNPLDAPNPAEDNGGAWVALVHGSLISNNPEYVRENTAADGLFGPLEDAVHPCEGNIDRTQMAFLYKIITPDLVVQFNPAVLNHYRTPRYLRSQCNEASRIKDVMVRDISVFAYSGSGTLPTGPEMYKASFSYEERNPLKYYYLSKFSNIDESSMAGEPALTRITIGTDNPYHYDTAVKPAAIYRPGGDVKEYTFEYYDSTLYYEPLYGQWNFNDSYMAWSRGGPTYWNISLPSIILESYVREKFIHGENGQSIQSWMGREFFGYYYYHPEAWSMKRMTIPEGLTIEYNYESDKYKIGNNLWHGGGCRISTIITNPIIDPFSGINVLEDYNRSDTIEFTYGLNDDGIGFPSAMSDNWHEFFRRYSESPRQFLASLIYARQLEKSLGDNVSHEIQYPRIVWHYPGERGEVENYYTTSYNSQTHRRMLMNFRIEIGLVNCVGSVCDTILDTVTVRYGIWQDRSPFLGVPYKTVTKNSAGNTLQSTTKYFSWIPVRADIVVADGYTNFPGVISVTPFNTGDTISASYFVRLDSIQTTNDGVGFCEKYTYDNKYRLESKTVVANDHDRITKYTYASSDPNHMGERHYFSALGSVREYSHYHGVGDTIMDNHTRYRYKSDLPSQNYAGQEKVYYPSSTEKWVDRNNNRVFDDSPEKDEVLDIDAYGNPIRYLSHVPSSGSDSLGSIYLGGSLGNLGAFQGTPDPLNDLAGLMTGQNLQKKPLMLYLLGQSVVDSSVSFTGKDSYRIRNTNPGGYMYGPSMRALCPKGGTYIGELWAKCDSGVYLELRMKSIFNGVVSAQRYKLVDKYNQWQYLTCTLSVSPGDSLLTYAMMISGVSVDSVAYVDEFRIYRAGTLAQSTCYDALGREITMSDNNNIPTRYYYNQYNEPAVTANLEYAALEGIERFYKKSEYEFPNWLMEQHIIQGHVHWVRLDSMRYYKERPNSIFAFQGRKKGLTDDFITDPYKKYSISGPGTLAWNQNLKRLVLSHTSQGDYKDITISLETFRNGFLALDCIVHIGEGSKMSGEFSDAAICMGFENENGQGYSLGTGSFGTELIKYTGPNYAGRASLESIAPGLLFHPGKKVRVMLGKIDGTFYVVINGYCARADFDTTYGEFNSIKLRLRDCAYDLDSVVIDNLVFYNDPVVTADFINSFGLLKQRQVYDGSKVRATSFRNTLDFKRNAEFLTTGSDLKIAYSSGSSHYFDYFLNSLPLCYYSNLHLEFLYQDWDPGESLADSQYIRHYYTDSVSMPDCIGPGGLVFPYTEYTYYNDPLRRLKEIRPQGLFRGHPVQYEYAASEDSLPGLSPQYFGAGQLYKEKTIDENGGISVTFRDKLRRPVAAYADSVAGGRNVRTRFHYDFGSQPTLIVDPDGNKTVRKYNNIGWLIKDSSGDYGVREYMYDSQGKLRFSVSAWDREQGRFNYKKYDRLGRVIEEGYVGNPGQMTPANAADRLYPDTSQNPAAKITAVFEYDKGLFGRGRLTKATRYASHAPDSASWSLFEYDSDGNVICHKQLNYIIDNSTPKIMAGEYDLSGNLTRLIYPNGKSIGYNYNWTGEVSQAADTDSTLKAVYDYWPDGNKRKVVLGHTANFGPAQTVDYRYNCRGWLTGINDGAVVFPATGNGDHFSLALSYQNAALDTLGFPAGYYNGNVSSYITRHSPGLEFNEFALRFAYDKMDRIQMERIEGNWIGCDPMTIYSYTGNGRIIGVVSREPDGPNCLTTGSQYLYYAGTNRLERLTGQGMGPGNFEYNASGSMTRNNQINMSMSYNNYEEMVHRSRPSEQGPADVSYYYNTEGQRITRDYSFTYSYECGSPMDPDDPFDGLPGTGPETGDIDLRKYSYPDEPDGDESGIIIEEPIIKGGLLKGEQPSICHATSRNKTGYYYFGDDLASVYGGGTAITLKENDVFVNGERIASFVDNPASVRYYLTDHLGTVTATVKYNGDLLNKYKYKAFGQIFTEEVTDPLSKTRFGYTGKEREEELGEIWNYFGARYYHPRLRIFTQVDPQSGRYPSLSPYTYCANNPMKYVDPDGEFLDYAFDIASLIVDAKDLYDEPTLGKGIWLGIDVILAVTPVIPTSGVIRHADDAFDAVKGLIKSGDKAADATKVVGKTAETTSDLLGPRGGKSWSTARKEYWKQEVKTTGRKYTSENIERMRSGKAPQRENPSTGKIESQHLHHKEGNYKTGPNLKSNLQKLWPSKHGKLHQKMNRRPPKQIKEIKKR